MGNQQRSSKQTIDLINKLRNGVIGETYKALAFYHNNRPEVPNQKLYQFPQGLIGMNFKVLQSEGHILMILGITIGDGMVGYMEQVKQETMQLMN